MTTEPAAPADVEEAAALVALAGGNGDLYRVCETAARLLATYTGDAEAHLRDVIGQLERLTRFAAGATTTATAMTCCTN